MAEYSAVMIFSLIPIINILAYVMTFAVVGYDFRDMLFNRVGITVVNDWLELSYEMLMRFFLYVIIAMTFITIILILTNRKEIKVSFPKIK